MYNRTTKELFGVFSFISPFSMFRFKKPDIRVARMKNYCYVFPQKSGVWHSDKRSEGRSVMYKYQTLYWFLFWQIIITHARTPNFTHIPYTNK